MLDNRYGHFDHAGRAFVITDWRTPSPWCNVICNGRYGLIVSQNGGGFSWIDDAQHAVITRWEMDLVRDDHGKFLYITDLDSGEVWSAAPAPCQPMYDRYACSHTPGVTTFATERAGVRVTWRLTVAPDDNAELWAVEIENTSSRPRRLRVATYFEWCCGVAPDAKREFHKLFFTTRHQPTTGGPGLIVATKNMWDVPARSEKDHWNRPWPYAAAHAVYGAFDRPLAIGDKASFLGRYGTTAKPAAMIAGEALASHGFGRFSDPVAALGGDLTIGPGESRRLHAVIAAAACDDDAAALAGRFANPAAVTKAFARAGEFWSQLFAPTTVRTEAPDVDLLTNTWLPYQAVSGRMWGRTGYYQQSGARGFRDQLQDSQLWLAFDPARTADQILLHASRQFPDGSVNHWWHALADFGNHTLCSDDYLWLAFVTAAYLRETGDLSLLRRVVPFMPAKPGMRPIATGATEGGAMPEASILDHCLRAIARSRQRLSPRGLPLIGSCDWNDGLSACGVDGKGESVWLAMFLCQVLAEWSVILRRVGQDALADSYTAWRRDLVDAVNRHAWDDNAEGGWYRVASKDSGEWLGDSRGDAGQIHLNPQTWSIIAAVATPERQSRAWQAVRRRLLKPFGPLLLDPAYSDPDADIGYITRYSPGSRENGGVYMHAATWALLAACQLKDQEAVGSIWRSISPPLRGRDADAYVAEPFVTPGNVDGPLSPTPGRAGWTWYTGSAAWLHRVTLEWVLGVRPVWTASGSGLLIDPCPPPEWGAVTVRRTWRGLRVTIRLDARQWRPGVIPTLILDGEPISGQTLDESDISRCAAQGRSEVEIHVVWGDVPARRASAAATSRRTAP